MTVTFYVVNADGEYLGGKRGFAPVKSRLDARPIETRELAERIAEIYRSYLKRGALLKIEQVIAA